MNSLVDEFLVRRIARSIDPELTGDWPTERLASLRDAGVFRWGLPEEFGGRTVGSPQLLEAYIELARLCLTTTFILTQRDAACHRIAGSPNAELRQTLLPDQCAGRSMATVGISHLSTSRQHWTRPSVAARTTADGYEITGEAPWVTGAAHADLLVTGASLENGEQILVALPTRRAGVTVGDPLKLLSLNASCTGSVLLDRVAIHRDEIVFGPAPHVMKMGATGGTGSLTTTAVAIGAAARTLGELQREATSRPELADTVNAMSEELSVLRTDLIAASSSVTPNDAASAVATVEQVKTTADSLRYRANSLVMRLAQVFVCSAKGAGFVSGHLAERFLREAMFFQVWSCPPAVTQQTLSELARGISPDAS